jgi:hypothetical protein
MFKDLEDYIRQIVAEEQQSSQESEKWFNELLEANRQDTKQFVKI